MIINCELSAENTPPFLGMVLKKDGQSIMTSVYVKVTNTGLLLHYNSRDHKPCLNIQSGLIKAKLFT